MVSSDSVPRPEPVDPVYDALFRPTDAPPPVDPDDAPMFEQVLDAVVDPRLEDAAQAEAEALAHAPDPDPEPEPEFAVAPPAALVDTGRLFRSQGVAGHPAAVLALTSDHGGRLRTLDRRGDDPSPPDALSVPVSADELLGETVGSDAGAVVARESRRKDRAPRRQAAHASGQHARSISAGAVYIVVIGVTLLVAFANALLSGGGIGWPTGLALLASSVYCALTVRRDDDVVAIITPPIAFFLAAITAGQLFRGAAGGGLLNRAQLVFFTLADNWYWVIGATLAAAVIVIVRRRRA